MMHWFCQAINSTPLRSCVPEKILQHEFVPICDTNVLSQTVHTSQYVTKPKQGQSHEYTSRIFPLYAPVSTHFLIKLTKPVLNTPDINVGEHLVGCNIVGSTTYTHTYTKFI